MLSEQGKKFQHWQSTMKVLLSKAAELILQRRCHPTPISKAHVILLVKAPRLEKEPSKETGLVGQRNVVGATSG